MWTTPRTYVAGELMTAAIANTHWRDNLALLKTSITDDGLEWTGKAGADFLPDGNATRAMGATGTRFTDLFLSASLYERARTTPIGQAIAVAHAGSNFTAGGSGTWTVEAADQQTYEYDLVAKEITVAFSLTATSVGGTPNDELYIAIPGGFLAASIYVGNFYYEDAGGGGNVGYWIVAAGDPYIRIRKMNNAAWSVAANNTSIRGTARFRVQ